MQLRGPGSCPLDRMGAGHGGPLRIRPWRTPPGLARSDGEASAHGGSGDGPEMAASGCPFPFVSSMLGPAFRMYLPSSVRFRDTLQVKRAQMITRRDPMTEIQDSP